MGLSFCDPWQAETFLNLFDNIPAKVLKSRIRTEMTDEYWKEVMELGKILAWEVLQINNIRVYWLPFRLVIKCRSASYVCLTVTLPPTSCPTPQHLSGSFLIKLKLYRRASTSAKYFVLQLAPWVLIILRTRKNTLVTSHRILVADLS